MARFRILHLTDLHLRPLGNGFGPAPELNDSPTDHFIGKLGLALVGLSEAEWPKAVIVTGDLVEKGGAIEGEMEAATKFLKDLAKFLKIATQRVFVVPGNHDVDWRIDGTFEQRTEKFRQAMADFTTPEFDRQGQPIPRVEKLHNVADGVDIEIALLVSPTLSGINNPDSDIVYDLVARRVSDWSSEQLEQLRIAMKHASKKLDIAAIGATQRKALANSFPPAPSATGPVRIAAMHHHLLPDPKVEFAAFDSVLDAGCVLDLLLDRDFDLVLTGHKHNRRLIHYSRQRRNQNELLDVYTGPSLFANAVTLPGFTFVDVYGSSAPAYAHLLFHDINQGQLQEEHELVREERVMRRVLDICRSIDPEQQNRRVAPLLEDAAKIFTMIKSGGDRQQLITKAWDAISEDLAALGAGAVVFRPPGLNSRWNELLEIAAKVQDPSLCLVSLDDVDYWEDARTTSFSEAANYEDCVKRFPGKKERILILGSDSLDSDEKQKQVRETISWMQANGIDVCALPRETLDGNGDRNFDFGIISGIVVSRFEGAEDAPARALREHFSDSYIRDHERMWAELKSDPRLWRKDLGSFDNWIRDNYRSLRRPRP